MPSITPIPSTRISDPLVRSRLLSQLQYDQLGLFRVQNQISTGQRIFVPSDDAPAALRGIALQRLLERKQQVQSSLATNQTFLTATDTAVGGVAEILASVRGTAISVIGDTADDDQRLAAAEEVDRALEQLVDAGNQKFRGRYLFAGSQTNVEPYSFDKTYVRFDGDEQSLLGFSDIDTLFKSNVNGTEIFGGISAAVKGTSDLNPLLTLNTRISDLNGGAGISEGSIRISDGTHESIIDVSRASTVGDIIRLIERNPPAGRIATVTLTNTGLNVSLDASGGGDLTISEVSGGTTAADLGIRNDNNIGAGPIVGEDLNPRLTLTTSLDNLGVRATATVAATGARNDLVFTAVQRGATSLSGDALNGVVISYVDGGPGTAGSESAVYDDSGVPATLTITIEDGVTTANDVITAVAATGVFTAALDTSEPGNNGTGRITATAGDPAATGTTSGGSGIEFDRSAGLQIQNGGQTHTITFNSAQTVEDVLVVLNGSNANVLATINAAGTGLDIRSRLSGSDFSIGENGGQAAAQLGVRTLHRDTALADLNFGFGVHDEEGTDLVIRRKDGVEMAIDVAGLHTVGDFIDAVNNRADNQDPATRVTASLTSFGNGIRLTTESTATTATFAVLRDHGSQAAEDLGLLPIGADASDGAVAEPGGVESITGRDVNPLEAEGVFTALARLSTALRAKDAPNQKLQISRAVELLDESFKQLNFSRAELGARQQSLDVLQQRLESEETELQSALSEEIETDTVEAISELASRQAALQASLAITGQISRLTLLEYL
ncbi:MAG: flagellin [Pirellulales bacterium]